MAPGGRGQLIQRAIGNLSLVEPPPPQVGIPATRQVNGTNAVGPASNQPLFPFPPPNFATVPPPSFPSVPPPNFSSVPPRNFSVPPPNNFNRPWVTNAPPPSVIFLTSSKPPCPGLSRTEIEGWRSNFAPEHPTATLYVAERPPVAFRRTATPRVKAVDQRGGAYGQVQRQAKSGVDTDVLLPKTVAPAQRFEFNASKPLASRGSCAGGDVNGVGGYENEDRVRCISAASQGTAFTFEDGASVDLGPYAPSVSEYDHETNSRRSSGDDTPDFIIDEDDYSCYSEALEDEPATGVDGRGGNGSGLSSTCTEATPTHELLLSPAGACRLDSCEVLNVVEVGGEQPVSGRSSRQGRPSFPPVEDSLERTAGRSLSGRSPKFSSPTVEDSLEKTAEQALIRCCSRQGSSLAGSAPAQIVNDVGKGGISVPPPIMVDVSTETDDQGGDDTMANGHSDVSTSDRPVEEPEKRDCELDSSQVTAVSEKFFQLGTEMGLEHWTDTLTKLGPGPFDEPDVVIFVATCVVSRPTIKYRPTIK